MAEEQQKETYRIKIRGTKPILMNSPKNIGIGGQTSRQKSVVYDPEEEAKKCLYTKEDGTIGIPSLAVLSCLRKAATLFNVKGRGKKTYKEFVYSGIQIPEDIIPISPQEYTIDTRPVVIARSRVLKWRPKFDKWSCEFTVEVVNKDLWNGPQIRQILEEAGKTQGLLDFRPLFGLFEIESMVRVETGKEIR